MMPILAITHKDDAQAVYDALSNEWHMEWAKADRDEKKTGRLALLMVAAHAELTRLAEAETEPARCSFCNAILGVTSHAGGCSE